jgi:hypothetical protein
MSLFTGVQGSGGRDERLAAGPATAAGRSGAGGWSAVACTCLMVALYVAEPAVVSLTVGDHVQLDRVTGTSAERHGGLLPPGTTQVRLDAGTYVFRTTADARVQLSQDAAVQVVADGQPFTKTNDPDLLPAGQGPAALPAAKGDGPPDRVPALTVTRPARDPHSGTNRGPGQAS